MSAAETFRRTGRTGRIGRAGAGRAARALLTPVVHPWMHADPAQVRSLVDQLDGHLARYDAARAGTVPLGAALRALAASAPSAASGAGGAAHAPGAADGSGASGATCAPGAAEAPPATVGSATASSATGGPATPPSPLGRALPPPDAFAQVRAALSQTREALAQLADDLECHGPALREAVAAIPHADSPGRVRALRRQVRVATDALSEADGRCRRRLEAAIRAMPDGPALLAAALPVTTAAAGDDAAPSARAVRAALVGSPPARIAAHLSRHPEAVEVLAASRDDLDLWESGRTGPGRAITSAITMGLLDDRPSDERPSADRPGTDRPGDADAGRVAAIEARRAAFETAGQEALPLALLWPAVVGPLDGADPAARIAANRLLVRAELGRARRADIELEVRAIARRVADASSPLRTLRAVRERLLQAWLTRDAVTSLVTTTTDLPLLVRADLRVRILLYEALLHDRIPDPGAPAGWRLRQPLLFDGEGRGRIAELWGRLDATTRAVAVLVPGTGTAVRGFHLPTRVAHDLAQAVPDSAVIAWMGADFPLAIGSHALFSRYAGAAAGPLRDLLAGLPRAPGRPVTVLGHSYGGTMVGAAERVGLAADRVVHVASPGAGPGVRGVADYPHTDPCGRPREPRRYSLTAPGDPIRWAQRFEPPWQLLPAPLARRLRAWLAPLSLGVDPERLEGVTILSAGTWERPVAGHAVGAAVAGPAAHAGVMTPGTGAFRRLSEVVGAPL